jgi:hypothetical protein
MPTMAESKANDHRKLPTTLRVAIDSSPLEGAGRVEDTYSLLAHAARQVIRCAARVLGWSDERLCRKAGIPLLAGSSVKAALDLDWNDPAAKAAALTTLAQQLDALQAWLARRVPDALAEPPLKTHVDTLRQIRRQDLEPDPHGGGLRLREGVAPDRRVSIADPEMRHGRKSTSKRFNGFKRHIAADIDRGLILACAITPANRPEETAMPALRDDLDRLGHTLDQLLIDRGYINGPLVDEVLQRRGTVLCKPWRSQNGALFPKAPFTLNMRDRTITCPQGQVQHFACGTVVEFDAEVCDRCPVRRRCTRVARGTGRSVRIAADEPLQHRLRRQLRTAAGRAALRARTTIEHRLAHISQRQGNHARYLGVRKNTFDLRRASAIQNLETLHRAELESGKAA